jgi:hypothetical protein
MQHLQISSETDSRPEKIQGSLEETIKSDMEGNTPNTSTAALQMSPGLINYEVLKILLSMENLFDYTTIGNLRLISKELKSFIDKIRPMETLTVSPEDAVHLPGHTRLTEKVKTLIITDTLYGTDIAPALIKSHLPNLETLSINRAITKEMRIIKSCFRGSNFAGLIDDTSQCFLNWPHLKCLELESDHTPFRTLTRLAELPLQSLKELKYAIYGPGRYLSDPSSQIILQKPETIAAVLSNLQGLTKLDLHLDIYDELFGMFPRNAIQNLEDLTLNINVIVADEDDGAHSHDGSVENSGSDFEGFGSEDDLGMNGPLVSIPWAKLRRFDIPCKKNSPPVIRFVRHTLYNVSCLEELRLIGWKPEWVKFKKLHLTGLKKLDLHMAKSSLERYTDLTTATLPALEALTIMDHQNRPLSTLPLADDTTSPFLTLRSLKVVGEFYPALTRFTKSLKSNVTELKLGTTSPLVLEQLFGQGGGSPLESNPPPVWPLLSAIHLPSILEPFHIPFLRMIPAMCPSLESMIIEGYHDVVARKDEIDEIEAILRNEGEEGVWNGLKSVEYRSCEYSVQIWPPQLE